MVTTTQPLTDDDPLELLGVRSRPTPSARPVDGAPGELDMRHRIELADGIRAILSDAARFRREETEAHHDHRLQVRDAYGRLADVEHALRSGIPIRRGGERLVARILAADAAGAYCRHAGHALHDDADEACVALGLITPFH